MITAESQTEEIPEFSRGSSGCQERLEMSAFRPLRRLTDLRKSPIRGIQGKGLVASYSAHRLHLREKKTKDDAAIEAGGSEKGSRGWHGDDARSLKVVRFFVQLNSRRKKAS